MSGFSNILLMDRTPFFFPKEILLGILTEKICNITAPAKARWSFSLPLASVSTLQSSGTELENYWHRVTFGAFPNNFGRSLGGLVSNDDTRAGLLSWAPNFVQVENSTFFLVLSQKVEWEICPEVALEESVPTSPVRMVTLWTAFLTA